MLVGVAVPITHLSPQLVEGERMVFGSRFGDEPVSSRTRSAFHIDELFLVAFLVKDISNQVRRVENSKAKPHILLSALQSSKKTR